MGTLTALTLAIGTGGATAKQSGSLSNDLTATGNVGAGEDNLISYAMPANTFVTAGQYLEYEVGGTFANNVNAKTVKLYLGGSLLATLTAAVSLAGSWKAKIVIERTGTSAQKWECEAARTITGGGNAIANTAGTCTETETAIITIKATGEGVADNDIIQLKSNIKTY